MIRPFRVYHYFSPSVTLTFDPFFENFNHANNDCESFDISHEHSMGHGLLVGTILNL